MTAAAAYLDYSAIDEHFVPQTEADMVAALSSWRWRIFSGHLYKVMIKGDDGEVTGIRPFRPNHAQTLFIESMHYRNVILKARQLGFTTLIGVLWFDHAMMNPDQRVGIIAHNLEDAGVIFADKVKFLYDQLPDVVKRMYPVQSITKSTIEFKHNSRIRVAVSLRSGTYHRVHISEMGKIAAKFPAKAKEIVTGTLPAVPMHGVVVIESTAEGKEGLFYEIANRAEKRSKIKRRLGAKEWKFHFFPWWIMPEYQAPANDNTPISATQHAYFAKVEQDMDCKLSMRQRRWYVAEKEHGQAGDDEGMWREYPSTHDECWMRTNEGAFFRKQMAAARATGRIGSCKFIQYAPVNTFWDIGNSDGTAIWMQQHVGTQARHPRFLEGWGEPYVHFINLLEAEQAKHQFAWGIHYLPHDALHERQTEYKIASPLDMLRELRPTWRFEIVPRTPDKQAAIQLTRTKFPEFWFDEEGCAEGIAHLDAYHKKWNSTQGTWSSEPEKRDGHSEAADALMQEAQGFDPALAANSNASALKKVRNRRRRRA